MRSMILAIAATLVGLSACQAVQDGKVTGRELVAAASSGGASSNSGGNESSSGGGQGGLANAPAKQTSWKDVMKHVEVGGDEISVTFGETAKAARDGEPRCRYLKYAIIRQYEGGGKYAPPEISHDHKSYKGAFASERVPCSEAESAEKNNEVLRFFSDNDLVVGGSWYDDWDVEYNRQGRPRLKARVAKIYTKETKSVEQQIPTPTRDELEEMVARAVPKEAIGISETSGYDRYINRVESIVVSSDLQYIAFDSFKADDPHLFAALPKFRTSSTRIHKEEKRISRGNYTMVDQLKERTKHTCDGMMWFYIRRAGDDEKDDAYDLQGTKVVLRIAMMDGPQNKDGNRVWNWGSIEMNCAESQM